MTKRNGFIAAIAAAALMTAFLSCAKPPQAEIDNARAAVGKAQKNADVVTYAADSLKLAESAYDRMESELRAKRYDQTKAAALEAISAAVKAETDAVANKAQAKSKAGEIANAIQASIPEAEKSLGAAKKVPGLKLDLAGAGKTLVQAKADLAGIRKSIAAEKYLEARDAAASLQTRVADLQKAISDAVQAATKKK